MAARKLLFRKMREEVQAREDRKAIHYPHHQMEVEYLALFLRSESF